MTSVRLAAVGFVTLLGQVVLLREVLVASFGSELTYILAIGVQLLGTALGVVAASRAVRNAEVHLAGMFLAFAALLPLLVGLARAFRVLVHGTPGAYLPIHLQLAGIALVVVPAGALGGALFSRAAQAYVASSRTLASAYACESAGGLAGGVVSTLLIALGVQNFAAAILCSFVALISALIGLSRQRPRWLMPFAIILGLALLGAAVFSRRIDLRLTAINHPSLVDSVDTPYGRATITGSRGQIVLFENDALVYESEGTSAEELVHVSALQVEHLDSVLLLSGAVEGLVPEMLKHKPSRWHDVELDRRLVLALSAARRIRLPDSTSFEDPRRFLERPGHYDLIVSAMPEPESGQASRFYTKEFFDDCARRLSPYGVLAFRLASSENLWTPALARRTASIERALRAAFADVVILPGTSNVFLASNRRLTRDPDLLAKRMAERGVTARLVSPPYLRYLYTNDRREEIERRLAATPATINSDARPICYQYTLVRWLSRFMPSIASVDLPSTVSRSAARLKWPVAALIVLTLLLIRRSHRARGIMLVAFAGFAGMILEGSLILGYQMTRGVLYQDLGMLLAMFMSGLAAGSWAVDRWVSRASRAEGATARDGIALLVGLAILACFTAWAILFTQQGSLAGTAALIMAAGLFTGGLFAYASLRRVESQERAIAPLYGSDLLGGCVGSMAGSLFLLPVIGLPGSVLLVGALALLALTLV